MPAGALDIQGTDREFNTDDLRHRWTLVELSCRREFRSAGRISQHLRQCSQLANDVTVRIALLQELRRHLFHGTGIQEPIRLVPSSILPGGILGLRAAGCQHRDAGQNDPNSTLTAR